LDATTIAALSFATPLPVFAVVFALLWFRGLYGTARAAACRCLLFGLALVADIPAWPEVSGHVPLPPGALVGVLPTMIVTVIIGRHLYDNFMARELAARRDAVHVMTGAQLLGVVDASEIRAIAWDAAVQVCSFTPGLRVLEVVSEANIGRVAMKVGEFLHDPAVVCSATVATLARHDGDATDCAALSELDACTGELCVWNWTPIPDEEASWLVAGAPTMDPEIISWMRLLVNQVALAMRNGQAHRQLVSLATRDPLTGLANRALFHDSLATAARGRAHGVAVLFIDIDDFKDVNDAYGHAAGDAVLTEVGRRLARITRRGDLCARLGGDEFAVLLEDQDVDVAQTLADRVVTDLSEPVLLREGMAQVAVSIGIASGECGVDPHELIHQADVAMYAAKAGGKGRAQLFTPGLLQPGSSLSATEEELIVVSPRTVHP
jgi:diguanylate cyclase (GGDEF)-like protein